jgi:6-phosphogluconolactonase
VDHQTFGYAFARRDFLKLTGLATLGLALPPRNFGRANPLRALPVYVGTYTSGKSEGIYLYRLDLTSGELRHVATTKGVKDPSYLTLARNGRYLYAVNEVEEFAGKKSGAVSAFAIEPGTGALRLLNQQPSLGGAPCYIITDQTGKFVLIANYIGGNTAVLPVNRDGSLGTATDLQQDLGASINPARQEGPHAHCIVIAPANRFAYGCDLGADKVMIYRFDQRRGKLSPNRTPFVRAKPGAGPRHLTFHPAGGYVYVINELDNSVTVYAQDPARGDLNALQTVPTLPPDFSGANTGADIHVSPNGRFLYCSNRGHDSIATFAVDSRNGRLAFTAHEPTGGKTPRNFVIDPTGRFLLAANQNSDTIVVFRIDQQTGRLRPTGKVAEVPSPVCLKFAAPVA